MPLKKEQQNIAGKPRLKDSPSLLQIAVVVNAALLIGLVIAIVIFFFMKFDEVDFGSIVKDILFTGGIAFSGYSLLKFKRWALIPLYIFVYSLLIFLVINRLLIPLSESYLLGHPFIIETMAIWVVYSLLATGWCVFSIYVMSFKYREWFTWR